MRRRTPQELKRAQLVKIIRSHTRLKYSIQAEEELNEVPPFYLEKYDRALTRGEEFTFDTAELP